MLKDIVKSGFHQLVESRIGADRFYMLRGELEIIGRRNGKIFHYDKGPNTVTVWGKHVMMHILTGESFTAQGAQRSTIATDHKAIIAAGDTGYNNDGTLMSNQQYFDAPTFPGSMGWWSRADSRIPSASNYIYPIFPVKLLFGTGFEYAAYNSGLYPMPSDFQTFYASTINAGTFGNNGISANDYSNNFGGTTGDSLIKMRSVNDIYSSTLATPTVLDSDFGIPGAIKDGMYHNSVGDSQKLQIIAGNYFSNYNYWGIGKPAFLYAKRESRFYQSGSEIGLDFDSNVENKITYSVTLPEQTGTNAGRFYPHNGFVLKVAGLFCDARFFLRGDIPIDDAHSDDSGLQEYKNYTKMPYGMIIAKRYIAPITKSHDVSITARWTLYL